MGSLEYAVEVVSSPRSTGSSRPRPSTGSSPRVPTTVNFCVFRGGPAYGGLPSRTQVQSSHTVCMTAIIGASPMVSGTSTRRDARRRHPVPRRDAPVPGVLREVWFDVPQRYVTSMVGGRRAG